MHAVLVSVLRRALMELSHCYCYEVKMSGGQPVQCFLSSQFLYMTP